MEQERINANVSQLSQKLLEGCKLLSESCPETNVPLVSTLDGRMYSVRENVPASRARASPPPARSPARSRHAVAPGATSPPSASKNGPHLAVHQVGNACYYTKDGGELVKVPAGVPPPPATPAATMPSPGGGGFLGFAPGVAPGSVEAPTSAASGAQSLSSKVAAKLLEGFTLLSESCPVTSVPLVQNAHGQILSVGTGKWYSRTGGELLESGAPTPLPSAHAPSVHGGITAMPLSPSHLFAAMPPPPSVPPRDAAAGYSRYVGTPQPPPPVPPASLPAPSPAMSASSIAGGSSVSAAVSSAILAAGAGAASAPPPSITNGVGGGGGGGGGALLRVGVQQSIAVLSGRLSEATKALADAPLREAPTYVALVKDIALAIAALRAL